MASIPQRRGTPLLSGRSVSGLLSRRGRGSGMTSIPQSCSIPPRGIASLLAQWSVAGRLSRRGKVCQSYRREGPLLCMREGWLLVGYRVFLRDGGGDQVCRTYRRAGLPCCRDGWKHSGCHNNLPQQNPLLLGRGVSRRSVAGLLSRQGRGSGMTSIPQSSSIPPRGLASLQSQWSVAGRLSRRGKVC